mmetsp:Transcript_27726/g.55774  ORF Transcript_27726/g.55774 Transcript_27726/m.55774 type:complete len:255 (+) Transcript_27726:161-925(+)
MLLHVCRSCVAYCSVHGASDPAGTCSFAEMSPPGCTLISMHSRSKAASCPNAVWSSTEVGATAVSSTSRSGTASVCISSPCPFMPLACAPLVRAESTSSSSSSSMSGTRQLVYTSVITCCCRNSCSAWNTSAAVLTGTLWTSTPMASVLWSTNQNLRPRAFTTQPSFGVALLGRTSRCHATPLVTRNIGTGSSSTFCPRVCRDPTAGMETMTGGSRCSPIIVFGFASWPGPTVTPASCSNALELSVPQEGATDW